MKFESIYDFFRYLTENNIDLCKMDIELKPIDGVSSRLNTFPMREGSTEKQQPPNFQIFLEDLTENPCISSKISSENVLYVEDCSMVPNSCGTISIKILNRDIMLNACRTDDGTIKTKLNIRINENTVKKVDFFIKKDLQLADTIEIMEKVIYDEFRPNSKD